MMFNGVILISLYSLVALANVCETLQESCFESEMRIIFPVVQNEGVGSKVLRVVGSSSLRNLDPFLLFDHFFSGPPGGFPDHPHRGFSTLTYMIGGTCMHEDFLGNKGEITSGDLQLMNAGRGIVHAEMPKGGQMTGIQLWINLHSSQKLSNPSYQELQSSSFPNVFAGKFKAKVLVGSLLNETSPIKPNSQLNLFDVEISEYGEFDYEVLLNWNCLIYVISGEISVNNKKIEEKSAGVAKNGKIYVKALGKVINRFLIVAGEKIGESVVQRGPFVMNNEDEIRKAIKDYNEFANGFEYAKGWRSAFV